MGSAKVQSLKRCLGLAAVVAVFLAGASNGEPSCTAPVAFIVDSQAAADALSNCSTVTGNLVIQGNDLTQITLNGIGIIEGNLETSSCDELQDIVAPSLSQITKNFTLSNIPVLNALEFPLLDSINGGIFWDTVPGLTNISFGNLAANDLPGANVDGDISILNTGVTSLEFLNFTHFSNPDLIWIKGNQQLGNVNLTGLSWGSNSLEIIDNGPAAQVLLPNLRSVGAIIISNAGRIDIPTLSETSANLEISNNALDAFSAPNLTAIGGSLVVSSNDLSDISLPSLTSIDGNFSVSNNTGLDTIRNVNQLWYTHGNVSLTGNFSNVTLPNLRSILTGFHLNSSNAAMDCTTFDKLADSESWTSSFYSCGAYLPGENKDLAKHYQSPKKSLALSRPVKAIIIILSIIAGFFLCALLTRWWWRKRHPRRRSVAEEPVDLGDMGHTRQQSEGEGLPKYTRVGKPGEVPPGYNEGVIVPRVEAENLNEAPPNASPERARGWWRLW
ncbi:uncharacterized protein PAC_12704 [Phialocephala subalpina]|uniref:Sporulation-specific protein 2 n=1 Tax=Phialocephala subalpina TaxID=576137 RepID=A0A1L7XCW6_9HELO|nr:uncharacterized protein PAC_12704 [Phialocephala subalpina]